jgi:predicted nucleic acid-binding protein
MGKLDSILSRIQGRRVYLDTNAFIYFLDKHDVYFDVVLPFFQLFNEGLSFAYTGDAAVTETLYKPYELNDPFRVNELIQRDIAFLHHSKNVINRPFLARLFIKFDFL